MSKQEFFPLIISNIRPQTANGVGITFEVPADLKKTFSFIPGQYLTLRAKVGGEDIRRAYSICSGLNDTGLEVGIKQVEDGAFSNHALTLQVGDEVLVMRPQGRFTADIGGNHNYLLLAAGSGITPCLSIAKSVLQGELESTVTLVYGNRSTETMIFLGDLNTLKDRYTERLQLIHVMSLERQDVDFLNGRVSGETLDELTKRKLISPDTFDAAYICGPQTMIKETSQVLQKMGMDKKAIHFELFSTDNAPVPARRKTTAPALGAEVTIILDGSEKIIRVEGKEDTILSAAQKAGMDLPFSCAGGMCCTCRCKVVEGDAEMDVNYSLQDWELEAGFTLACQTRPTSDKVTLDFDAS